MHRLRLLAGVATPVDKTILNCYDNAMAEHLFSILNTEHLCRHKLTHSIPPHCF